VDTILQPLQPQVFAWLRERGISAAGPPFWKYNVLDEELALLLLLVHTVRRWSRLRLSKGR
jgi:hypothetical protein